MPGRLLGLHHVALPFPGDPESVEQARRFYGGMLGLQELAVPEVLGDVVLWFRIGDQELHLFAEPSGVTLNAQTRRHPCFETGDLAALRDHLEEDGMTTIDANPVIEGRPRFFVVDPFGNALELIQPQAG